MQEDVRLVKKIDLGVTTWQCTNSCVTYRLPGKNTPVLPHPPCSPDFKTFLVLKIGGDLEWTLFWNNRENKEKFARTAAHHSKSGFQKSFQNFKKCWEQQIASSAKGNILKGIWVHKIVHTLIKFLFQKFGLLLNSPHIYYVNNVIQIIIIRQYRQYKLTSVVISCTMYTFIKNWMYIYFIKYSIVKLLNIR